MLILWACRVRTYLPSTYPHIGFSFKIPTNDHGMAVRHHCTPVSPSRRLPLAKRRLYVLTKDEGRVLVLFSPVLRSPCRRRSELGIYDEGIKLVYFVDLLKVQGTSLPRSTL